MVINKILNNNVVIVTDENGIEKIVMGRGLAFQKKVGEIFDDSKVDKVFTISNSDTSSKFQELVNEVPLEYVSFGDKVISYAKTILGKKLNELIYVQLTDHIYSSIKRFNEGIVVRNVLLYDIKRFYPDEFAIAKDVLIMIKDTFNIILPDDEAGYIALHLVNAELDEQKMEDMYTITKVMQEITTIVKYVFNIEFDEDSLYYYRFITHLKFFAQRLVNHTTYEGSSEDELLGVIKSKYKNAYACTEKIAVFINDKYQYVLSDEEKLYLTIHIERIVYKSAN